MGHQTPKGLTGIRGPLAYKVAHCSEREAGYWRKTGLICASVADANGPGTACLFDVADVCAMRVVKSLRDAGLSLQKVRRALREIRKRWPEVTRPLASLVLVTDGRDLFRVLPEAEARDTLLSLALRPGELAWRRVVVEVSKVAAEVRAALERAA